jgi:hypothetical protein
MPRLPAAALSAVLAAGLAGCYDRLPAPSPVPETPEPPDSAAETTPERPIQASAAGTGQLAENLKALGGVLDRLGRGSASRAPEDRPGSALWRPAELEKLRELVTAICSAGSAGCRDAMDTLVAADLPHDELRAVLGLFVGPLRPHGELGFATLGAAILTGPDADSRDIAFRIAVAAGVTRRGEPDRANVRAALVPQTPTIGSPAVVVVELPSPCRKVRTEHKGPDVNGRIDVRIEPACEGEPEPALGPDGFPQPARAVWALALDSVPPNGVSVWDYGATAPRLEYRPLPLPTGDKPEGGGKDGNPGR